VTQFSIERHHRVDRKRQLRALLDLLHPSGKEEPFRNSQYLQTVDATQRPETALLTEGETP